MLKSGDLIKQLRIVLNKISVNKKAQNELSNYLLKEYNYNSIDYMEYVIGAKDLEGMPTEEMYWLINGINNLKLYEAIDIKKYFSDIEVRKYSNSKKEYKTIDKYPVVINNVIEVTDDLWMAVVDTDFLKTLYEKQLIIYNPNTQRELKKVTSGNGYTYYSININAKSVSEIKSLMLTNNFIPNDLSFNLSIDNPEIEFDIQGNSLILNAGQFDIIDGYHRFKAAMELAYNNPGFKYKFIMKIMNYTEEKACMYIAQEDKRNKISSNHAAMFDLTNPNKLVVDKITLALNSKSNNYVGVDASCRINNTDLFGAVKYFYNLKDVSRSEISRIANHIVNVIDSYFGDTHDQANVFVIGVLVAASLQSTDVYECCEKAREIISKGAPYKMKTANKTQMHSIKLLFN